MAVLQGAARRIHLGRILLTVLAAVLFGLGWLAGAVVAGLVWAGTAIALGWTDARGRR